VIDWPLWPTNAANRRLRLVPDQRQRFAWKPQHHAQGDVRPALAEFGGCAGPELLKCRERLRATRDAGNTSIARRSRSPFQHLACRFHNTGRARTPVLVIGDPRRAPGKVDLAPSQKPKASRCASRSRQGSASQQSPAPDAYRVGPCAKASPSSAAYSTVAEPPSLAFPISKAPDPGPPCTGFFRASPARRAG